MYDFDSVISTFAAGKKINSKPTMSTMEIKEEIEKAITILVEAGFEVTNKRGGYVAKNDRNGWFHQSCYRSTLIDEKEQVIDSFLSESGL